MTAPRRILVVEDNALNRKLLRDLLAFRGYEVLEAVNVAEARVRLKERPDIVLMDLQLPDGSGDEVLREIRADEELKSLPVVVVTASAMSGEKERLLAAGFDAYVSKPIDTRTFCTVVESLIAQGARGS